MHWPFEKASSRASLWGWKTSIDCPADLPANDRFQCCNALRAKEKLQIRARLWYKVSRSERV